MLKIVFMVIGGAVFGDGGGDPSFGILVLTDRAFMGSREEQLAEPFQ